MSRGNLMKLCRGRRRAVVSTRAIQNEFVGVGCRHGFVLLLYGLCYHLLQYRTSRYYPCSSSSSNVVVQYVKNMPWSTRYYRTIIYCMTQVQVAKRTADRHFFGDQCHLHPKNYLHPASQFALFPFPRF